MLKILSFSKPWRFKRMSRRVQVILDQKDAIQFRSQAQKELKSLSAWLRDAGKKMLEISKQKKPLSDPSSLKSFFKSCKEREKGREPDWEDYKKVILEGYNRGVRS
jgi:hypothetical protein